MNILPHKSWHVRTKKNIERVRRDEEKAAEAEKEKQRKIALAEQEARTSLLKSRVKRNSVPNLEPISGSQEKDELLGSSGSPQCVVSGTDRQVCIPGMGDRAEHINFFKDIEDGLKKQGKNKEHEDEKKKEQEELEKKIGLLTYLGQSVLEGTEKSPWDPKKSLKRGDDQVKTESNKEEDKGEQLKLAMEAKQKSFLDPLMQMKQYVDKKKKKHRHKEHRHKHKRKSSKEKTKSSSSKSSTAVKLSVSSSISSPPKKTIDELRAERLARENQERLKVKALMGKTTTGINQRKKDEREESDSDSEVESRGVKRKYNSQYNPEFVRQPKSKKSREFF